MQPTIDPFFEVVTMAATPLPQQLTWAAMHQCYSENAVAHEAASFPPDDIAGARVVKHLLSGNRGHYGPLEHATITVNVIGFPHSLMQQITRHRLLSFDVQSGRYTGARVCLVDQGEIDVNEVFYSRPAGVYVNREGKRYEWTLDDRLSDRAFFLERAHDYAAMIARGISEEHARERLPYAVRQDFVMSGNIRSLMHLLDMRWKKDAQQEAQWFAELLFSHFADWCSEIAGWYQQHRAHKARLSP